MIFLLQFEEPCAKTFETHAALGTTTKTAIATEQTDTDPDNQHHSALKQTKFLLGTQTVTKVQAESTDADRKAENRGGRSIAL